MYRNQPHSSQKKQSHTSKKQFKRLQPSKQDTIKKLLYVFTFYAGRVSKYTFKQMQEKYFMELMGDVWTVAGRGRQVEKGSVTWRDLQNVYHAKGRKNVLDFGQFLEVLPVVGLYFEPEAEKEESLKAVIYYISAIYDSVVIKQLKQTRVIQDHQQQMNEDARQFIFKLVPDLFKLYKLYFVQQLTNKFREKDYFYKSFESYLQIMKEFQVYPKIVSASQLFFVYNEAVGVRSQLLGESRYSKETLVEAGEYFRFSKFLEGFLPVSRLALTKLKQINDPEAEEWMSRQKEMLKILFEYMETVKTLKKKTKTRYSQTRFSLIIYEEYPEEQSMKKFTVNDKRIEEPSSQMGFYDIFSRLQI